MNRPEEANEEVDPDDDFTSEADKLDRFVHNAANEVVGDGMVLRSIIIFQYLDASGVLKNGILHHQTIAQDEAIAVVVSTAKNFTDNGAE